MNRSPGHVVLARRVVMLAVVTGAVVAACSVPSEQVSIDRTQITTTSTFAAEPSTTAPESPAPAPAGPATTAPVVPRVPSITPTTRPPARPQVGGVTAQRRRSVFGTPGDSMVLVTARGCQAGRWEAGSGVTIGRELIATNAHVVSGQNAFEVETTDGSTWSASLVGFDPTHDLAILRVPGLDTEPLDVAAPQVGDVGLIVGHPRAGPIAESGFAVAAVDEPLDADVYGQSAPGRTVVRVVGNVVHGESGSPLLRDDGVVIGLVFAGLGAPDETWAVSGVDLANLISVVSLRAADAANGARDDVDSGYCLIDSPE